MPHHEFGSDHPGVGAKRFSHELGDGIFPEGHVVMAEQVERSVPDRLDRHVACRAETGTVLKALAGGGGQLRSHERCDGLGGPCIDDVHRHVLVGLGGQRSQRGWEPVPRVVGDDNDRHRRRKVSDGFRGGFGHVGGHW